MKQTKRMAMCGMMAALMVYDFVLPRVEWLLQKKLGKSMKR